MDLAGKTLGQFRITEAIGRGGMAAVYKAYQPSLDRYVAIKVLSAQHALTPDFSERFVREARAIAQLNHPNILPVIDFGQEDDLSYIVMKYVPAGTLKGKMGQPMELETALRLLEGIAAALDHAHSRGILHRDVKPGNVLLDENDWALLADFGLAKMVSGSSELTGSGVGIGTPAYMSPEQCQGMPVDVYTDIYALGIVLYEMVTGRLPFDADTPFAVVMKQISDPLPLPRSIRADLPEDVERIILKATAKTPQDRFETAGDLARALRAAITPDPPTTLLPNNARKKATPRLADLYTQALGYFYTEQWAKAIKTLETIVATQPNYEDGDAARRLEQSKEQVQLADLYTQAQRALSDENWMSAIARLKEIIALNADYRDAEALLKQAKRQKELGNLYSDAKKLHDSGQWQAVVGVWDHIRNLDANYPDTDGLLTQAQSKLRQERAAEAAKRQAEGRARHLSDLYRRGLTHMAADEWQQAATLFAQIETMEPDYQETSGLLERARREIASREAKAPVIQANEQTKTSRIVLPPDWKKYWPALFIGVLVIIAAIFLFNSGDKTPTPASLPDISTVGKVTREDLFVSNRSGKREIYRMSKDGNVVQWTHSPGGSESWSPTLYQGGSLVFASDRDGKREIYRMDKDGNVAQWTHSPGKSESWGPNVYWGDLLVFTSNRSGKREIHLMDKDGNVTRWTHSPGSSESWGAVMYQDKSLVFTSDRDGKREIYRITRDGEVIRWTHSPDKSESWSPVMYQDDSLVFTANRSGKREIYRLDKEGTVTQWTHSPGNSESWSPSVAVNG
ncbi:MAG TPA: protein kinase, partial [Chloroflexi bacterium]|nr:protein kinase [Chloroflexota bacterium]